MWEEPYLYGMIMLQDESCSQGYKSALVKKSETLQCQIYMGVQIYAWSGSLWLESEEWSRFTVK